MSNKLIVSIGNDHGGVDAKFYLIKYLRERGIEVIDEGTDTKESCDYPIFAKKVANDVKEGKATFGILICNTGEGMEMAANKVKGIRAGLIYNDDTAHLVKEHNHANVITFGAKFSLESKWLALFKYIWMQKNLVIDTKEGLMR